MPALDDRFFQVLGLVAILLYLIPSKPHFAMTAATGLVFIGIAAALAMVLF